MLPSLQTTFRCIPFWFYLHFGKLGSTYKTIYQPDFHVSSTLFLQQANDKIPTNTWYGSTKPNVCVVSTQISIDICLFSWSNCDEVRKEAEKVKKAQCFHTSKCSKQALRWALQIYIFQMNAIEKGSNFWLYMNIKMSSVDESHRWAGNMEYTAT